ncbi:MAG: DUF4124 domain-containing protein [Gammaproteobacteria bacterium]|nr:DUF4124 domain-containing protein [Gammaproteobacteria bacterium]
MIVVALILLCWTATTAGQDIFRWSNDDGSVTYSDQAPPTQTEATRITPETLPPLQIVPAVEGTNGARPTAGLDNASRARTYASFSILKPKARRAIRANDGDLAVAVDVRPGLRIAAGHTIQLYLNGKSVAQGTQSTFHLAALNRGAHHLRAEVLDPDGKALISTDTVHFTLLRHSRLF